ncbi:hypothetical protein BZG36_02624 [Bifiguratus adelaidae]|uniref:Exostosin GT47 domain-containing protein n=1 Tax=Bifiguratus adelaidae TaxID=1938954 RepID=A0A261Y2Q1_9FUNG|nr:hypothetical protein BZG36_02624 [Bifiguratus adelaidae]
MSHYGQYTPLEVEDGVPSRSRSRFLSESKLMLATMCLCALAMLAFVTFTSTSYTEPPESSPEPEPEPEAPKPIILDPLPQVDPTSQWPAPFNVALCKPKIYVYTFPEYLTNLTTDCEGQMHNYGSEQVLHQVLLDKNHSAHQYVTQNPEEADFFFIPFYGACFIHPYLPQIPDNVDDDYVKPVMKWVRDQGYWHRSNGTDHIMIHPMDRGATYYKAIDELLPAIFLTTIGDRRLCCTDGHRFRRARDIVIPSVTGILDSRHIDPYAYVNKTTGMPLQGERDLLGLFRGCCADTKPDDAYSNGIRSLLFGELRNSPDYSIEQEWDGEQYAALLSRAKYGITPMGYTLDTTRVWEYLAFGVVPVVIADGIVHPFEDDIDWDAFTVRIPRDQAHRIDEMLRSISNEEYERYRSNVWKTGRRILLQRDAWHLIVRGLCRMKGMEGVRRGMLEGVEA